MPKIHGVREHAPIDFWGPALFHPCKEDDLDKAVATFPEPRAAPRWATDVVGPNEASRLPPDCGGVGPQGEAGELVSLWCSRPEVGTVGDTAPPELPENLTIRFNLGDRRYGDFPGVLAATRIYMLPRRIVVPVRQAWRIQVFAPMRAAGQLIRMGGSFVWTRFIQ